MIMTTEQIAERLEALLGRFDAMNGDEPVDVLQGELAKFALASRAAAALIRAQAEALRAAQAALAAYEGAHNQDKGAWSLAGLHDAEALSVNAQAKIDAALKGEA